MATARGPMGRPRRPSTFLQTARSRINAKERVQKPAGSRKPKFQRRAQPLKTARVLRSTTVLQPSPQEAQPSPQPAESSTQPSGPSLQLTQPSSQPAQAPPRSRRRRRTRADPWLPKRRPKTAPKPRLPPPTHHTCRICAEEQPVDSFITWISNSASHARRVALEVPFYCVSHLARNPWTKREPVCRTCIGAAMAARHEMIGARSVSNGCLEPGCENVWDFDAVMRFFPKGAKLEAYNHDMLRVWLADSDVVTCTNPDCGHQGLPDRSAPGYPELQCPSPTCKTRFCARCAVPWHKNQTCAEHAAQHLEAKLTAPEKHTLELVQKDDGRRCPNCYIVIEKLGGCDSMYCEACKTYFNWATAASAVPGARKAQVVGETWHIPPRVGVCEMDALEGKGADETQGVAVSSSVGVPPPLPAPVPNVGSPALVINA